MPKFKISCCSIALLPAIAVVVWIIIFIANGPPEIGRSKLVVSPDGRYEAYVGTHGWYDHSFGLINLKQHSTGRTEVIHTMPGGWLSWSPDSTKIAVSNGCEVEVHDILTRRSGTRCIDLNPVRARRNMLDRVRTRWLDNNTIVFTDKDWVPGDSSRLVFGKASVTDTGKNIKIENSRPPKMKISELIYQLKDDCWEIESSNGNHWKLKYGPQIIRVDGRPNDYITYKQIADILDKAQTYDEDLWKRRFRTHGK